MPQETCKLETLFGIPNYRYKVWLARHLVQHLVLAVLLLLLATLCEAALADFSIAAMVIHLMFPIAFLSSVGFILATTIRSGNGAAALLLLAMVIVAMRRTASEHPGPGGPVAQELEPYLSMVDSELGLPGDTASEPEVDRG